MTNNYSFTNFVEENNKVNEDKPSQLNPIRPAQVKYYTDLCTKKNVTPQPLTNFDYDSLSAEIQRLIKYFPASAVQLELIRTKVAGLKALGSEFTVSESELSSLTGGYAGTASALIGELIEMEKEFKGSVKPTDAQIETIVGFYLCPDVDFEKVGVSKKVFLNALTPEEENAMLLLEDTIKKGVWTETSASVWEYIDADERVVQQYEALKAKVANKLWRQPTPQEFAVSISNVMSKQQASSFIEEYRGIFYAWKKTRARHEQIRYIQQLESQLSQDRKLRVITQATDEEGNVIELKPEVANNMEGACYTPMSTEQLIMLSIEEASEFIDQLKNEVAKRESSPSEAEVDYMEFRPAKSVSEAIEMEYEEFKNLMFKLEAVAGYNDDDLHDAARYDLVANDSPEANKENRLKIRTFIKDMLETEAITFYEVLELAKDSITAQKILLDM